MEWIPNKRIMYVEHSVLCKRHGHCTWPTKQECCKYKKDSTPKKDFSGRKAHTPLHGLETFYQNHSVYVQISAKIDKLEKSNKELKYVQKKHKCHHKSGSKDSNPSWRVGNGSTGEYMSENKKHTSNKYEVKTYSSPNKTTSCTSSKINVKLIDKIYLPVRSTAD